MALGEIAGMRGMRQVMTPVFTSRDRADGIARDSKPRRESYI
jgi:hypothetical protein